MQLLTEADLINSDINIQSWEETDHNLDYATKLQRLFVIRVNYNT